VVIHMITIEHTPDELVREYSVNEPLDCAPGLFLRLLMLFSRRARRNQHVRESGYIRPFFFVTNVRAARVDGNKVVITIEPFARWDEVEPEVTALLGTCQYWNYLDPVHFKIRAPSV